MLFAYLLNEGSKFWGKKWRNAILFSLRRGPQRFSYIKKEMGHSCSVKVLSEALDEMEKDQLIIRKQYDGIPVKVTYELHKDMESIGLLLEDYHLALIVYFYNNAERLKVPHNYMHELQNEVDKIL